MKNLVSKKDKIFIAGHKGMVGSSIIKILKNDGYKNLITCDKEEINLRDKSSLNNWFKINNPDIVIDAAAKVGGIGANSKNNDKFLLENLEIQNSLISISFERKVKRFLFLASSCVYPKQCRQPMLEEDLLNGKLEPTNEGYALAKIAGLKLCDYLNKLHDFDAFTLLPCNLYGKGDNFTLDKSHVLAALLVKFITAKKNNEKEVTCWGSGRPFREFLYVDDLARASIFALEKWHPKNSKIISESGEFLTYLNVGSGTDITIADLADKISNIIKYEGEIIWDLNKQDGMARKLMDSSRFKELGWSPKYNLDEGIKTVIDYLIRNLF